jgi:biotin transport system permease protein
MVEITLFHYHHNSTLLNKLHPLTKVLALLILSTLLPGSSLLRLSIIFFVLIAFLITLKLPLKSFKRELRFFMIMVSIITLFRYLVSGTYLEAILVALRFITIVLMGIIFTSTTSFDLLSPSIASLLKPIIGNRAYKIAFTLELTLSTIPLIFDLSFQVSEARKARGENILKRPIKSIVEFSTTLFSLLLEKGEMIEHALIARNFSFDVFPKAPSFKIRDLISILITVVFFLILFWYT